MTDEQLIASAQALLDLDASGPLVPHGIGGHARTIIEGFLALSRRVPASGGEAEAEPFNTGVGWENLSCDDQYRLARMIASNVGYNLVPEPLISEAEDRASPIVAAPEGWKLVPIEPTPEMLSAGLKKNSANPHPWLPAVYRAMLAAALSTPVKP